jgi:hypothetical protein
MRLADESSVNAITTGDKVMVTKAGNVELIAKSDFEKSLTQAVEGTHTEVLTFDVNSYTPTTLIQGGPLAYTLAASGHKDGVVKRLKVQSDGSSTITFPAGTLTYGMPETNILPAGLHILWMVYLGGELEVSIPTNAASGTAPDDTENGDVKLATVTGLTATPNGTTAIDLQWEQVVNNQGYQLQVSADNATWSNLEALLPQNTLTYQHGGLAPGTLRYYRVRAKGNGTTYGDGDYSTTASATTFNWGNYGNLGGLVLNLQADNALNIETDNSTYFRWKDRSNLESDWEIADATMLPTYDSTGKFLQFGGLKRLHGLFETVGSQAGTIFYVVDKDSTSSNVVLAHASLSTEYIRHTTTAVTMAIPGGTGFTATVTSDVSDKGVFAYAMGTTNAHLYRNGTKVASKGSAFYPKQIDLTVLGYWPSNSVGFAAKVYAVVAYNRELSEAEIQEVTGWLNTAYALY